MKLPLTTNNLSIITENACELAKRGGWEIVFKKATNRRTVEQNAKLHAMLGDFVKQRLTHQEKEWTVNQWKRLMTIGWMTENNERPIMTTNPSNGGLVVFWENTSGMTTKQLAELVEYVYAYGVQAGVKFTEK